MIREAERSESEAADPRVRADWPVAEELLHLWPEWWDSVECAPYFERDDEEGRPLEKPVYAGVMYAFFKDGKCAAVLVNRPTLLLEEASVLGTYARMVAFSFRASGVECGPNIYRTFPPEDPRVLEGFRKLYPQVEVTP